MQCNEFFFRAVIDDGGCLIISLVKMRLLTHNMLASHVKGVKNGFPLAIEVMPLRLERNFHSEYLTSFFNICMFSIFN